MKRILGLAALLGMLAGCGDDGVEPVDDRTPLEYGGGEFTQIIRSGEAQTQRAYLVVVPPSARPEVAAPLLLVLHGENQSVEEVRAMSQMDELAGERGWIVAYPQALYNVWAVSPNRFPRNAGQDDEAFFLDIVDYVNEDLNIDLRRVYVVGFSNGALMAQRAACTLASTVAGVAGVAASMTLRTGEGCLPVPATPVVLFLGTQDRTFDWEGSLEPGQGDSEFGGPGSADWWADVNGCLEDRTVRELPDVVDDGTTVEEWIHGDCAGNAEVRLYAIWGGGHQWPGSPVQLDPVSFGPQSRDISASETVVDFFAPHTLGGG